MTTEPVEISSNISVVSDSARRPIRAGRFGETDVSQLMPPYYELAKRGKLFTITTPAAGIAIPAYTAAAQAFVIYNPEGSGVDIVILRAWLGYVSTTMVAGHLCWAGAVGQTLPGTATSALIQPGVMRAITGTNGTALGNVGNYYAPASPATALGLSNYIRPFGTSNVVQAATATNAPWSMSDEVEGSLIVPERGVLVIAGNIGLGMVCTVGAIVAELPK